MGEHKLLLLAADLERELAQHLELVDEARAAVSDTTRPPDRLRLRGIASILHDFYTGLERMLERIAVEMDGELPAGHDWHAALLDRMATPVESVRPAVLSTDLAASLRPYLRFRHLFRNIYGSDLRWDRCRELVAGLDPVSSTLAAEVAQFVSILRDLHQRCA